jgi:hypothetical protein
MPDQDTDRDRRLPDDRPPAELVDEYLRETLTGALGTLSARAQDADDDDEVERAFGRVREVRRLRQAVDAMARGVTPATAVPVYLVSATFLAHSFALLTRTPDEHLVYATGPEDGKQLFALTRVVTFDLAEKSRAHALPDPRSQVEALMELDRGEERLLATLHSHPDEGSSNAAPSSTDLSTQANLERMRFPTIGIVFSRDGFVRFYSVNRPFRVVVSGAGCERVEDRLYHITAARPQSLLQKVVNRVCRS